MQAYGAALLNNGGRIGQVNALRLEETLSVRRGPRNLKAWAASIVDGRRAVLLDTIDGRNAQPETDGRARVRAVVSDVHPSAPPASAPPGVRSVRGGEGPPGRGDRSSARR